MFNPNRSKAPTAEQFQSTLKKVKDNDLQLTSIILSFLNPQQLLSLAQALKENTAVKILSVTDSVINTEVADALIKMLEINNTLEELRLPNNEIYKDAQTELIQVASEYISLKVLDLSNRGEASPYTQPIDLPTSFLLTWKKSTMPTFNEFQGTQQKASKRKASR